MPDNLPPVVKCYQSKSLSYRHGLRPTEIIDGEGGFLETFNIHPSVSMIHSQWERTMNEEGRTNYIPGSFGDLDNASPHCPLHVSEQRRRGGSSLQQGQVPLLLAQFTEVRNKWHTSNTLLLPPNQNIPILPGSETTYHLMDLIMAKKCTKYEVKWVLLYLITCLGRTPSSNLLFLPMHQYFLNLLMQHPKELPNHIYESLVDPVFIQDLLWVFNLLMDPKHMYAICQVTQEMEKGNQTPIKDYPLTPSSLNSGIPLGDCTRRTLRQASNYCMGPPIVPPPRGLIE
ncbi:hypothetical protein GYMLUDRAFT_53820 [Collybiopsis luxurians FD-317 M1]|nr:hypothetical protein GYMLUDRAFT_53820 [Collybiopsis luxurians FD-317 M1]